MNWLTKIFTTSEKRSGTGPTTLKAPSTWLLDILGITPDEIVVNEVTAMSHSAVWACVRVLSETIAQLPFHVYKKDPSGSRFVAYDHPIDYLISQAPSTNHTSFTFRETLQTMLCLHGNAYALINRNGGNRPISFTIVPNNEVTIKLYKDEPIYKVNGYGIIEKENIIHIPALTFDGFQGLSPISAARQNIQLGMAAQQFGYNFFKNGANLNGYLTAPEALTDEAYERMKASWNKTYTGHVNSSKTAILEAGTKYERIGIPPEDAQFLETRKFQINEIARIFRVPPHMVGDLERATFSNIEHQAIEFVTHTIMPWLVRWEQEFNRKVFRADERGQYYVKFNTNALLRGDAVARAEYYTKLFQIGAISQNDIRKYEDMNAIEGGDRYFIPLNMAPADKYDEMMLSKDKPQEQTQQNTSTDGKEQ